jgi:hypothetical protein
MAEKVRVTAAVGAVLAALLAEPDADRYGRSDALDQDVRNYRRPHGHPNEDLRRTDAAISSATRARTDRVASFSTASRLDASVRVRQPTATSSASTRTQPILTSIWRR